MATMCRAEHNVDTIMHLTCTNMQIGMVDDALKVSVPFRRHQILPDLRWRLPKRKAFKTSSLYVEIHLEDPFASTRHARLVRQGGIVVIEDLGSTNGTYLNEELLEGPRPLHPGDRIRIGDSTFTYED